MREPPRQRLAHSRISTVCIFVTFDLGLSIKSTSQLLSAMISLLRILVLLQANESLLRLFMLKVTAQYYIGLI